MLPIPWARFDAREFTYQNFVESVEGRRRYWQLGRETYPVIRAAAPNAGHQALAELHRLGRLDCCITQNIDDLSVGNIKALSSSRRPPLRAAHTNPL